MKLVAANGNWTQSMAPAKDAVTWKEVGKGTYPDGAKGSAVCTIIEANTIMFGGADEWKTWAQLNDTQKGYMGGSQIQTITISNNAFIQNTVTFEKQ